MSLRLAAKDHKVTVKTTDKCSVLFDKLEEKELTGKGIVKLFYCGREMKPEEKIGNYTNEDSVITVFLRAPPSN